MPRCLPTREWAGGRDTGHSTNTRPNTHVPGMGRRTEHRTQDEYKNTDLMAGLHEMILVAIVDTGFPGIRFPFGVINWIYFRSQGD